MENSDCEYVPLSSAFNTQPVGFVWHTMYSGNSKKRPPFASTLEPIPEEKDHWCVCEWLACMLCGKRAKNRALDYDQQ